MPGDLGATVVTNSCVLFLSHARLRGHWAPGIPPALIVQGRKNPCIIRAHRAAGILRCVPPSLRAKRSNPALARRKRKLDCFVVSLLAMTLWTPFATWTVA